MKKHSLIFLLFLLITNSCYYLDTESNRVDIILSYNPEVSIISTLDGIDSIRNSDSIYFRYEIDIDTGKFFYSDLILDNILIARFDSIIDSLWIPAYYIMEESIHNLTMVARYKTYSGSLADLMNTEYYIADTTWSFIIFSEN
ncbi:MAG: hypothetical protein PF450_11750 [Bacteroidales bacterium]|jgi:hypothetical protein|nr:hypothetical protein [Bacteroidales bacterium]